MLQYLDRQRALGTPMQLSGIDSQHTGELSKKELISDLQSHLSTQHPRLAEGADWHAYAKLATTLFEMDDFVSGKPIPVPAPGPLSLEYRLGQQSKSVIGLTPRAPIDLPQFSYEYLTSATARLRTNWDVLFFIPTVTPVTMTR